MGWAGFKNGDLLTLASEQFDIFVTMDRNLSHQQDLASLSIAVIVLASKSSRLAHLEPLAAKLLTAIETAEPGSTTLISE
jgi:hypothetical protein